jgi:hypothetical protein
MKTFAAIALSLCISGFASAASLEEDTNQYVQSFAVGKSFDVQTVESLAWKGISDPRLFDLIERRILDAASEGYTDKSRKNEVGLYLRALGFSGQPKYRQTLMQFYSDATYGRYAKTALEDLPNYQKWNPIISNRATFDPKNSDEANRILNMLNSDDFELKKIGSKRVYFSNKDDVLLETLVTQIKANYTNTDESRSDSIAWMLKALGSAKQPKYRPLLEEVAVSARDKTIVKHAKKALES